MSGAAMWGFLKLRKTPVELERRRRIALDAKAKMGDGVIVDVRDNTIYYSYEVRGVAYTASQDVSSLLRFLPTDLSTLGGPVMLKYNPKNPANSIVVSEEWSGLRVAHQQT